MKGMLIAWRTNIINAIARTDQANPILSKSLDNMIGITTPPTEDPATTIPTAMDRFARNQCEGITSYKCQGQWEQETR